MARSLINSSSQYLQSGSISHGIGTGDFTIAGWVNLSSNTSTSCIWSNGSYAPGLYARLDGSGNAWGLWWSANSQNARTVLSAGQWYHLCVRRSGTTVNHILDGVNDGNRTLSNSMSNAATYLGWSTYATEYVNGTLHNWAIWNVCLADNAVASLAAGYSPKFYPENRVAHWALGGFDGDNDNDTLGTYNLTAYNSPTYAEQSRIIYPIARQVTVHSAAPPATSKPALFHAHYMSQGMRP